MKSPTDSRRELFYFQTDFLKGAKVSLGALCDDSIYKRNDQFIRFQIAIETANLKLA